MDFNGILKSIKGNFSPRKSVDFEDQGLHFEIEPLTSKEEVIVLESCKDVEESEYIEALKRHTMACSLKKINDLEIVGDEIEYEPGKFKSRFLFMVDYLAQWPSSLIDLLFEAFTHMSKELEQKVKGSAKFDRFNLSDEIEDEEEKGEFRRIVEDTSTAETEMERLKERVDKEIQEADTHRMSVESVAVEAKENK